MCDKCMDNLPCPPHFIACQFFFVKSTDCFVAEMYEATSCHNNKIECVSLLHLSSRMTWSGKCPIILYKLVALIPWLPLMKSKGRVFSEFLRSIYEFLKNDTWIYTSLCVYVQCLIYLNCQHILVCFQWVTFSLTCSVQLDWGCGNKIQ